MNDRQIIEYLRARGQVTPPVEFTRSVMGALDSAPVQPARFSAYLPAFVAVGAAAVVAALALLVGPGRDFGPAPSSSATPSASASAVTIDDLGVALLDAVDVLRAAPGVEGRQQAEIDGTIGSATWFDWRPNGDQVVVQRLDLDVMETGWWMVPDGAPPATGQRIYTFIGAKLGDDFYFTNEAGDWEVAPRGDGFRQGALGPAILDGDLLPWRPLDGLVTSLPAESEARVARGDLPDGGVEWQLESQWLGAPLIQRWTIGPGGELRSWTLERDGRTVDPEGDFNDNITHAWLEFTITDGDPIEPPDIDAVPDADAVGVPADLPLRPATPAPTPSAGTPSPAAAPLYVVRLSECPPSSAPFRLILPDGWWTNTAFKDSELGDIPACQYFAAEPFDPTTATRDQAIPEGVAVTINYYENTCLGYISPILEERTTTVDGHPALIVELAQGKDETNPPGAYQYEIALSDDADCDPGGRFIVGRTTVDMTGDYEANKAILDEMMSTIQIEE